MNKKVIKEYLKRVDDLNTRLVGKDKETFGWLIYGYNQCAKLLHEKEEQIKEQKEIIDKIHKILLREQSPVLTEFHYDIVVLIHELLSILKRYQNEK